MKPLLKVGLIIALVLLALGLAKDFLIRSAITAAATRITGAPLKIERFSLGIIGQSVEINGLRMYNPPGFENAAFLDIPRAKVGYDIPALIKGKLHLREADFSLKELVLVKNSQGKLNVDSLNIAQKKSETPREKQQQMPMQIDVLTLDIGRVVYKDYTSGPQPSVKVHEINLKRQYTNITSPAQLVALIVSEPLKQAGIKGLQIYGSQVLEELGLSGARKLLDFIK